MSYESNVTGHRKKREDLIRDYQKADSEPETAFNYFPINENWKVPADITIRKPKEGMLDYKLKFKRIGKIGFVLQDNEHKFDLYQVDDNAIEDYYIYLKDGTSGKTSYGVGRFVKVLKEGDEKYFVDFNLSFTPACGHIDGTACPWARESTPVLIEAGEQYIPK